VSHSFWGNNLKEAFCLPAMLDMDTALLAAYPEASVALTLCRINHEDLVNIHAYNAAITIRIVRYGKSFSSHLEI
jgi:hypothetical protein